MHSKSESVVAFIKELTEKHQMEKIVLMSRIQELEKENQQLREQSEPSLLLNKGVIPFIQFSFKFIEDIMNTLDDESRAKIQEILNKEDEPDHSSV